MSEANAETLRVQWVRCRECDESGPAPTFLSDWDGRVSALLLLDRMIAVGRKAA